MYFIILEKDSKTQVLQSFESIHNASQFLQEFVETYIIERMGRSLNHLSIHPIPKHRGEFCYLPNGFILCRNPRESIYKTICYNNKSSSGYIYNSVDYDKIFTIDVVLNNTTSIQYDSGFQMPWVLTDELPSEYEERFLIVMEELINKIPIKDSVDVNKE